MLLAPQPATRRPAHPALGSRRRRGRAVAFVLAGLALLVATVAAHWGSQAAAVLTAILVNAALAPLPHARPLHRLPEPAEP